MARKFIEKYDVKIPLNINKLLDDIGIKIDRRYKLLQSDKSEINAQICLMRGMFDTADGLVYVEDTPYLWTEIITMVMVHSHYSPTLPLPILRELASIREY